MTIFFAKRLTVGFVGFEFYKLGAPDSTLRNPLRNSMMPFSSVNGFKGTTLNEVCKAYREFVNDIG